MHGIRIATAVVSLALTPVAAAQGPGVGGSCATVCPGVELLVAARGQAGAVVSRFCAANGGCIEEVLFFIADAPLPGGERFPIEPGFSDPPFPGPASMSQEVWTSDQMSDEIHRNANDGGCNLGDFGSLLDDIRGTVFANGRLWVTNHGTFGGAPGDALQVFDPGLPPGSPPTMTVPLPFEPYDVTEVPGVPGGMLLISNVTDDNIEAYDYSGAFLGTFHDSDGVTGINFPKQVSLSQDGTFVFAAGFEGTSGVYKYDLTGTQVDFLDVQVGPLVTCTQTGVNGVFELENGNVMWTCNKGIFIYSLGTASSSRAIQSVFNAQFIGTFDPTPLTTLGTRSCLSAPNSTGCRARIYASGSTSVAANDLVLECLTIPPNEFGIFFYGPEEAFFTFGNGFQCVGAGATGIGRLDVENSGSHGVLTHGVDYTMPPFPAVQILPGSTWYFSGWFRDPSAGGAFFDLSDRVELVFTP